MRPCAALGGRRCNAIALINESERPALRRFANSAQRDARHTLRGRVLRCEPLEVRRMLSVATGGENALELFSTSKALFVENQGQWADEAVRHGFHGDGVNIALTDDGLAFRLSQREVGSGATSVGESLRDSQSPVSVRPDHIRAPPSSLPNSMAQRRDTGRAGPG